MSLATVQQLLVDKVRTLALGNDLASPLVQERAIAQALLQYSADAPLQTYEDVANVSGGLFDVPSAWVAEQSALVAVEYPIGLAPMATLEAALQEAAQIDKMVKGLRAKAFAGDAWDAMLQLGLTIARGRHGH